MEATTGLQGFTNAPLPTLIKGTGAVGVLVARSAGTTFSERPRLYTWGTGFQGATRVLRWLKNVKKWSKKGQQCHF